MATNAPSLDDLYDDAGHKYDIDPLRIKAHAIQETGERAKVASGDGKSWGFGQFRPATWATVMPGVPLSARGDPATAIEAMGKYLAQLDAAHTDANGNTDVRASTAAYNGSGPAADAYAESVRGIHARLLKGGGLKTSGGQAGAAMAPAANDDDAFGQTLKASPTPAAPDKAPVDDAFGQTLKGGPATPAQEATAKPGAGPDAPQMMKTAGWSGIPGEVGGAAAKLWNLLTPPLPDRNKPANFEFPNLAPNEGSDTPGTPGPSGTIGFAGLRNALADPTGYTPSGIFPFAVKNDPTGQPDPSLGVRPDIGPLRPLARGVLDLFEGPTTGTVTPEASMALFNLLTSGAYPSVARGTGRAIAETGTYGAPLEDLYSRNRPPA